MREHEPWTVYDFPVQYLPSIRPNYHPPTFILGASLTLDEFVSYAKHVNLFPSTTPCDTESDWPIHVGKHLAEVCGLSEYFGDDRPTLIPLHHVHTKSQTPYVLPICTNYSFGSKFPLRQCERLLDELEKANISADISWFLGDDYSAWEGSDSFDWSDQYFATHS
ncbi:hypothetical protein K435DRAFT_972690 [Dendrothele bispora CBS 962.96]|uniref:Uncharacterized protein n=1 Tax=Dendrothele bispora (strain CBS 962.96) TaxID=1314807 RepID=A0A4S8KXI1_DENBC|nr:hypothetical protein K435DRAFT_972690 [Dendrothele bispora CBS 962.96]